jgi:hypothetical protein
LTTARSDPGTCPKNRFVRKRRRFTSEWATIGIRSENIEP